MQKVILSIFSPFGVAIVIRIVLLFIGWGLAITEYCFGFDKPVKGDIARDLGEFNIFNSDLAILFWGIVLVILFLVEMAIWEDRGNNKKANVFCIYDKILIYISYVLSSFIIGFIIYLLVGWLLYQAHSFIWSLKLLPYSFDSMSPVYQLLCKILIYDTLPLSVIWYSILISHDNQGFEQLEFPTLLLMGILLSFVFVPSCQNTFSFIHYIPSWIILLNASLFSLIMGLIIFFSSLRDVFTPKSVPQNEIEEESHQESIDKGAH